ncbi:GMC oxidoreductase [Acidobacteriota bacterium]
MYDVIIAGSGSAGTFAAYMLQGTNTAVIDTGKTPPTSSLNNKNLYDLRKKQNLFEETIGNRFESLNNIERTELSPKVKSPLMRYVVEKVKDAPDVQSSNFFPVLSYAEGGLANAWGAQVYRFNNQDLESFPIQAQDLEPYYDTLTRHIGISGTSDDLEPFHGSSEDLLPPLKLSSQGLDFLTQYKNRRSFFQKRHIFIGRPRLAVLSVDYKGRKENAYDNLEFFQPRLSSVYSPAFTLRSLVEKGGVQYLPGYFIERYEEKSDFVLVVSRDINTGSERTFRCKKLIVCLGALNTARTVLRSNQDDQTNLPILENPCSFTPLLSFRQIGMPLEKYSYSSQLNVFYSGPLWPKPVVGMIYGLDGLLRSDILFNIPLAVSGSIAAAKYLLPAMSLLQVFYSEDGRDSNTLKIDASGNLVINYSPVKHNVIERLLLKSFRRIGYYSISSLIRNAEAGMSIHYGGSLPMSKDPQHKYETYPDGRLKGTQHVYIGDSANFSQLPAKNLTFTIMANSMRIAEGVKKEIQREP